MDQQAFRSLLATPARPSDGGQDDAGPSSSSNQNRRFGAVAKRKADAVASSSTSSASLTSFAPRSIPNAKKAGQSNDAQKPRQVGPKKNSATGEAYVDRAKARRLGEDDGLNEFAEVERLREDWEEKMSKAKDEEEREKLREQMAYLGGDAKHSILVKGLDFALLEQQKARAAGLIDEEGSGTGGPRKPAGDDDLEALYEETKARGTSGSPAAEEGQARGKRSRDQVIEALKRRRVGLAGSEEAEETARKEKAAKMDELERQKRLGKFKPIGATSEPVGKAKEEEDKPEYIWKDGKRMRKKKKKRPEGEAKGGAPPDEAQVISKASSEAEARVPVKATEEKKARPTGNSHGAESARDAGSRENDKAQETGTTTKTDDTSRSPEEEKSPMPPEPIAQTAAELPVRPISPAAEAAPPQGQDDDDDEDIFADAGTWTGVALDDSDDEDRGGLKDTATSGSEAVKAQTREEAQSGSGGKRNWFSSGRDSEEAERKEESAQDEARALLARIGADQKASIRDEDEEGSPERPTRLQGLSDSVLPSDVTRALLEKEEERERRKAEKLKERIKEQREKKRRAKTGGAGPEGKEGED